MSLLKTGVFKSQNKKIKMMLDLVLDLVASAAAADPATESWFCRADAAAAAVVAEAATATATATAGESPPPASTSSLLLTALAAGLARAPVQCTWLGKKKAGRDQTERWVAWVEHELVPLGQRLASAAFAQQQQQQPEQQPAAAHGGGNRFGRHNLLPPLELLELDAHLRDRDMMEHAATTSHTLLL
jgi:hypothetical protein